MNYAMDFQRVSCDILLVNHEGNEREVSGMEDDTLVILRDVTIQLVRECKDADLLDLMCKLMASQQKSEHPVNSTVYQGL